MSQPTAKATYDAAKANFDRHIQDFERQLECCGLRFAITCSYRSPEDQAALYARGRTKPGSIVTLVQPWHSAHQWQLARDYALLRSGGFITDGKDPHWQLFGCLARHNKLVWGGDWKSLRDYGHVEHYCWRDHIAW